jgi:hypothetical protein
VVDHNVKLKLPTDWSTASDLSSRQWPHYSFVGMKMRTPHGR